jgi:hypothetical protein
MVVAVVGARFHKNKTQVIKLREQKSIEVHA